MKDYLDDIGCLLRGRHQKLPLLGVLFLIGGILDIVGLGLIGQYVANMISPQSHLNSKLGHWFGILMPHAGVGGETFSFILLSVFVLKTIIGIWSNNYVHSLVGKIEAGIRSDLLLGYQLMPYREWINRNSSEYINAVNVWVTQFTRVVLVPLIKLISDGVVGLCIFAFFAFVDWRAFLVFVFLICGVAALYDWNISGKLKAAGAQFRALSVEVVTDVRHAMDGFKEIRVLGAEQHFNSRIRHNSELLCESLSTFNTYNQMPRYLIELTTVVFAVTIVAVISAMGDSAKSLLPVFGIFAAGAIRLTPLISLMSGSVTNLRFYRDTIKNLAKDYKRIQHQCSTKRAQTNLGDKTFKNLVAHELWYAYEAGGAWALSNINLEIKAGQAVALVGPSGSGKTTMVDILLGLLEPTRGAILINGSTTGVSLSGKVAYLPQSVFLIDDTLRRNIALAEADENIDDERVLQALHRARLDEVVNSLPGGLDGIVGDRGVRLSGGQRQRLALARAFYFGREILVLDEATSAIDIQTEEEVIEEILALRGETTLIVITHRPSVAKRFDCIYRIESGSIRKESQ